MSVCYIKTARILQEGGELSEALRRYDKALTIQEALAAAEPMDGKRKRDLSILYFDLGEILAKQGNIAGSMERYRESLALVETLVAADPADVRNRQDLAMTCRTIGDALLKQGRFSEAWKNYSRALAITEELSRVDPMDAEAGANLAALYRSLGSFEEKIGSSATNRPAARRRWLAARSWYERSRTVWLELRKQNALIGLYQGKPQEVAEAISRCNAALAK